MAAAIPLFGAFLAGLGTRRWLQQHITLLFRLQLAGGIGLLSVLAGWSFDISVRNLAAIARPARRAADVGRRRRAGVHASARTARCSRSGCSATRRSGRRRWRPPTLGAEAAVFVIAYDMLTQARIAVGVRYMRRHAPKSQSARTALGRLRADDRRDGRAARSGLVLPAPDVRRLGRRRPRHRDGARRASCCSASRGRATAGSGVPQVAMTAPRARAALHARPGDPGRRDAGRRRPARARSGCSRSARCRPRSSPSRRSTATRRGRPRPAWRSASPPRSRCCRSRSRSPADEAREHARRRRSRRAAAIAQLTAIEARGGFELEHAVERAGQPVGGVADRLDDVVACGWP